jgi:DNA-binding Lrp family transcriptional regulator
MMVRRTSEKAIAASRKLVASLEEFGEQNMQELEISLGYSSSGTRKYVKKLRLAGVITCRRVPILGTKTGGEKVLVKLSPDTQKIAEFLVTMETGRAMTLLSAKPKKEANFDVGTMVHEIIDDLGVRIRKNTPVKVQRHWMDVALFGPAPESTGGAA